MSSNSHIIIYSHGFGVRKDDCGLFTDVAAVDQKIKKTPDRPGAKIDNDGARQ